MATYVFADVTSVPAELENPSITMETGYASIAWDTCRLASMTRYGADYWTGDSLTDLIADAVNDGELNHAAFTFPSTSPASITLDLGEGNETEMMQAEVTYPANTTIIHTVAIEYSDDGSTFTPITITRTASFVEASVDGGFVSTRVRYWASVGARRYWRVTQTAGYASGTPVSRVWFRKWGDSIVPQSYEIRDADEATYAVIDGADRPTTAEPLSLKPLISIIDESWNQPRQESATAIVYVHAHWSGLVTRSRATSASGLLIGATRSSTHTLTSGSNHNLALPPNSYYALITCDAGGSTLTGFSQTCERGGEVTFNVTGGTLTVTNNNAGSTDGSRTLTRTGGSISVTSGGYVRFKKTHSGYFMELACDSTGYL